MGGLGSGRWQGYLKKKAVEECLTLDVNALFRLLPVIPGTRGQFYWYDQAGAPRGALGFVVEQQAPLTLLLRVQYTVG